MTILEKWKQYTEYITWEENYWWKLSAIFFTLVIAVLGALGWIPIILVYQIYFSLRQKGMSVYK